MMLLRIEKTKLYQNIVIEFNYPLKNIKHFQRGEIEILTFYIAEIDKQH